MKLNNSDKELLRIGRKYINDLDLGSKMRRYHMLMEDYIRGKIKKKPKLSDIT